MRQRVMIACALSCRPKLLIADEPTTALDVTIQAQIMELIVDLNRELDMGVILITHDLSVVAETCTRVAVMYLGRVVEISPWDRLYENPMHPYTRALLSAIPIPDPAVEKARVRTRIEGEVPSLMNRPTGCVFHPRCPYATERCAREVPPLKDYDGHQAACWRIGEFE